MSLTKSATTRRLSLLTGSSLFAASLLGLGAVALTPTAALAYDECTAVAGTGTQSDGTGGLSDPSMNGTAADTFVCASSQGAVSYTPAGPLTLNVQGPNENTSTTISGGISMGPGGNVTINVNTRARITGPTYGIDLAVPTAATTMVNINNHLGDLNYDKDGRVTGIRAAGPGTFILNNDSNLYGPLHLSGLTSGATVNITGNGVWQAAATEFGVGDDTINIASGGIVFTGLAQNSVGVDPTHIITFGEAVGDADEINNAGYFIVNPRRGAELSARFDVYEAETRLEGLEVFNHSGAIFLGGFGDGELDSNSGGNFRGDRSDDIAGGTDGFYDDVLSMPGTRFVGQDGEVWFDVNLNVGPQANCTDRNADGDLAAADCLVLTGGQTEGRTFLKINDVFPGDRGAYNPDGILLVDVSGGTSAAEHFAISPNSAGYSAAQGGIIDKGVFFYALAYNEDTQQHKLVGLPGAGTLQLPLLTQAALSLWRTSTGTWLDRQADLRGGLEDGIGGGVWLRASTERAERDVSQTVEGGGTAFTFDNTFEQASYAVTGGIDLLSGSGGDSAWVVGVMAGYAQADIEFDDSPNTARFDGWTGGAYASFISGGLFVDAALNANKLVMDDDIVSLGLFPAGTILSTDLLSVGGQVEAGWRFPFAGGGFVEPLAAVSYVKTKYDDFSIFADDPLRFGADLEYDDPTSLRAGLGGRLGLDQDYGSFRAQYSVLGRVWNEFEGETSIVVRNFGPDAVVGDEFTGQFTEFGFGASLYSAGGAVSGFLNVGGKFGDDYSARTASAGIRVAW